MKRFWMYKWWEIEFSLEGVEVLNRDIGKEKKGEGGGGRKRIEKEEEKWFEINK